MCTGADMTLSAAAAGAEGTTSGDIQVSAYATIDYTGIGGTANYFAANTVGANIKQGVTASLQKGFVNTGTTAVEYQLNASLAGTEFINFDSFQSAGYSLAEGSFTASVSILELKNETSGTGLFGFELTESNTSDSMNFIVRPETEGYTYLLTAALGINTEVISYTVGPQGFESSELSGIFNIGNAGNPLVLTASAGLPVSTPVPPSLFLLISGVAGISFMRYRRDQ